MDLIYVVVLFVFVFLNLAMMKYAGWLISLIIGMFTLTIGGVALGSNYLSEIPFSPYLQVFTLVIGSVSMLVSAAKYKGWV